MTTSTTMTSTYSSVGGGMHNVTATTLDAENGAADCSNASSFDVPTNTTSTSNNHDPALDSQAQLRAILRDQSRREEQQQQGPAEVNGSVTQSSSTTAMQALQDAAASQNAESRSRRPSLVASVSAAVLGAADVGRSRKEIHHLPTNKSSSYLDSSALAASRQQSAPLGASSIRRQQSLRQQQHQHQDHGLTDVTTTSSPSSGTARLTRSRSTTGNLSAGVDLKVVILGAQGVGKTSLVHRYTSGQFSASAVPSTIGASFLTKKLVVDGVKVRLQLWDTAGQERFRSMAPMYYRGANAAVIVYDITNPSSFEDVKTWIDELRQNVQADLVIHIVGSKLDLAPYERMVHLEDAQQTIARWMQNDHHDSDPAQQASSPVSTSLFGSRRGLSTSPSLFATASQQYQQTTANNGTGSPPSSPSAQPSAPGSRIPGLGSLSALGGGGSKSRLTERNDGAANIGGEGDRASNPSTASSHGVNQPNPSGTRYIEVSEVSAKDNEGIEDVFVSIATRLVEHKEELEARALARKRQERESVFLGEDQAPAGYSPHRASATGAASWCCST